MPNCSSIDGGVFNYCLSLINAKIPICTQIDGGAFANCRKLTQVYLNSVSSVTTIQSNTFKDCLNLTSVYVPASLVDAFKVAPNWSSISDKIVAYREIAGGDTDMPELGGGEVGGDTDVPIEIN